MLDQLVSGLTRALVLLGVVVAGVGTPAVAFAENIDDILVGRATTSTPGIPQPVQITGMTPLPNGNLYLTYMYRAEGAALGELPGRFTYVETGSYEVTPAFVPVASTFNGGTFTVDPIRFGAPNVVVTFPTVVIGGGVIGGRIAQNWDELPLSVRNYLQSIGLAPGRPYATFTFTNNCGVHHGYATASFSHIAIEITLSC